MAYGKSFVDQQLSYLLDITSVVVLIFGLLCLAIVAILHIARATRKTIWWLTKKSPEEDP